MMFTFFATPKSKRIGCSCFFLSLLYDVDENRCRLFEDNAFCRACNPNGRQWMKLSARERKQEEEDEQRKIHIQIIKR